MNPRSVEFLRDYNDWRRGRGRHDTDVRGFDGVPDMPNPQELGEAIDWACEQIEQVRLAVLGYYAALDGREHGGVAQDRAFQKIERALGMHWEQGASLRSAAPLPPPPGETK